MSGGAPSGRVGGRARIAALVALAGTCAAAGSAGAQVRGTVVLPDSATPAPGIIVLALARDGATIARALTDAQGRFTLAMRQQARVTLRALRIGAPPTVLDDTLLDPNAQRALRIVLRGAVTVLPHVVSRGDDVCRVRADDGALVARVWEEARKALLASQLTAEADLLMAEWIEYSRALDATGRFVRTQQMRTVRNPTVHAFRSIDAEALATRGYVERDGDATKFHAPDVDVLLSESFAARHCFHIEPPNAERPQQIGVGFRPASDDRTLRDIEGTFWVDEASSELRTLEFRYTNLPAAVTRADAGGQVEFRRLGSGGWLVSRWHIRMPQLRARSLGASPPPAPYAVAMTAAEAPLGAVHVSGAEVTRVQRGDSALFEGNSAALEVQLFSRDSASSLAGATVSVQGTELTGIASDRGVVHIAPMIAGRYRLRLRSPLMDSLGAPPVEREVSISPELRRIDSLAMPSMHELLRGACGGDVVKRDEGLLRGRVLDASDRAVGGVQLTLTWPRRMTVVDDRLMWNEESAHVRTDGQGQWRQCGVPKDVVVLVRVVSGSERGEGTVRIPASRVLGSIELVTRRALATGSARESTSGGATNGESRNGLDVSDGSALLELSVVDSARAPVAGTLMEIFVGNGPTRVVRSDPAGRALVPNVVPGRLRVRARAVGFAAGELRVSVEAGRNSIPIVLDRARKPTLDTVRVVAGALVLARHEEFEARRRRGDATAIITRADVEARNPVDTWQLLTRVPSVFVVDSGGVVLAKSTRTVDVSCWFRVAINGIMTHETHPDLKDLPTPDRVYAIEVFSGATTMPIQYGAARPSSERSCGLIMVWTK